MYKPIETYYNGYHFRSRPEARWAVFFDEMRIPYMYEHEGYEVVLSNGERIRYLPDFYLPDHRLWAEVKGATRRGQIPKEDAEKMSRMIDFDGPCSNGIILLGDIPNPVGASDTMVWAIWKWSGKSLDYGYCYATEPPPDGWDMDVFFSDTAPCSFDEKDSYILTDVMYSGESYSRIGAALSKARQARFDHGETPTPTTR